MDFLPIVYVRGYAGTQGEIEETVDDPFYGFNKGSTHIRVGPLRAQFFAFESPLVRLMTDHRYGDVFEGERQRCRSADGRDPKRIIWVYRYYDPSSRTFDREGRGRLSIEECAEGLRSLILRIRAETGAEKVHLVAHSMGGLICRSLIQKIFPERGEAAYDHIDKFFTYGTPHGGIHFDAGGGAIEWIRDRVGWNNADDFGRQRMYEYLTPRADEAARAPEDFRAYRMDPRFFPLDRVFCAVGTNARDYDVAHGLSRATVGPRSDGLVQIDHAYVRGSHRAYIHRSHSGRYGMVNSEEGYQNLQRFLFGDVKVKLLLCGARLEERENTFYQAEAKVAIRGLPVIIHEQVLSHHSQIPLPVGDVGPVPLFTAFLNSAYAAGGDRTSRYSIYFAVHAFEEEQGFFSLARNLEQVPLWSDYLVVDIERIDGFVAKWIWASVGREPTEPMTLSDADGDGVRRADIPLPDRAGERIGQASVRIEISAWS